MSAVEITNERASRMDLALLMLRVVFAVLFLLHGIHKVQHGVGWMEGLLQGHGLPGFLRYGVYVGEVLAPVLVIVGLFTRPAAAIISVTMIFALWLVHFPTDFVINEQGGALQIELQLLFLFLGVFFALVGAGRLSLGKGKGNLH